MDIYREVDRKGYRVQNINSKVLKSKKLLIFKGLNDAIKVQNKYSKFQLLLAQDYGIKSHGAKRFLLTEWDWWMDNFAKLPYGRGAWFYEVLKQEEPCKLYFDIDGGENFDEQNLMNNIIPLMKQKFGEALHKEIKDPVILSASNDQKRSYHLIFSDIVCSGTLSCKEFINRHIGDFDGFDGAVYSSRRCFRICNSSKASNRPRPFVRVNYLDDDIDITYATLKQKKTYIDFVGQPSLDENLVKLHKKSRTSNFTELDAKDKIDAKIYVDELKKIYPDFILQGRLKRDGMTIKMLAKNIKCLNKQRNHKNNNMFITVVEKRKDTLNYNSNLPVVYVRCADNDCTDAAIMNVFSIY